MHRNPSAGNRVRRRTALCLRAPGRRESPWDRSWNFSTRARNQLEDLVDGHHPVVTLLGALVRQDRPGGLEHCRVGASQQLVGVDDDVDAALLQFALVHAVVARRHDDERFGRLEFAEPAAELEYLRRVLLAAVNHDAVRARREIGPGTRHRILHALVQDEAFDSGNDHEVVGGLGILASHDLGGKVLDAVLSLRHIVAEQGVLLEATLVLYDRRRYAESLERAHGELEMLVLPPRIGIVENWLRGHLEHFVQRVHASADIDRFDVGLALGGGIRERTAPHAVELADAGRRGNPRVLYDQAAKGVVNVQEAQQGLDLQHAAQRLEPNVGRDADLP